MNPTIRYKDGVALAAILSAAIGCVVLGIAVVLCEAFPEVKEALTWSQGVGPLSGKTSSAVIAWLVSWVFLHMTWRNLEISFRKVWRVSLILIAIGWLGTFPPFFNAFAVH